MTKTGVNSVFVRDDLHGAQVSIHQSNWAVRHTGDMALSAPGALQQGFMSQQLMDGISPILVKNFSSSGQN